VLWRDKTIKGRGRNKGERMPKGIKGKRKREKEKRYSLPLQK